MVFVSMPYPLNERSRLRRSETVPKISSPAPDSAAQLLLEMFRKAGPGRHFLHCRSNLRNLDRVKQMIHPAEIRGQIFAAENNRAGLSPDGKIVQLKRSGPIPAVVFDLRVAVRLVGAGAVEGVDHPDKTLHDPVDRKPGRPYSDFPAPEFRSFCFPHRENVSARLYRRS